MDNSHPVLRYMLGRTKTANVL
uniref:Uncharacterized protein n=1 Tax=Anguilla anguilla TaxID=7936 RepID=A0A0E9S8V6_ANGAN